MDWMSPMDASFLHLEGPANPMHIGGVSIFEGPAPPFEQLEEMVAGKLDLVPRYRQKVRFIPLGLGRPVWVDDPRFNLPYHLRHSALPPPGGDDQLRRTAARIFAQRLDRTKPLWEIWMLEGLAKSRWALLSKVHHCMVDGVSATDLMAVMFGGDPPQEGADPWLPTPEPSSAELVVRTITRRTLNPSEQLRTLRAATRAPRASLTQAIDLLRGMTSAARVVRPSRRLVSDRAGRSAPDLELGTRSPRRCQGGAGYARRHRQRCRADDRVRRAARPPRSARRERCGAHGPHFGPGVGASTGRARDLQQPRFRDAR